MQTSPNGWPRISASVVYDDARAAIQWLCKAFGFEVRLLVESSDGKLMHSELVYGDGVVSARGGRADDWTRSEALITSCKAE